MGDATVTCEAQPTGCFDWSAPVACPSATPFCSSGACSAHCTDECTTGQHECDGNATRACGQFDSDSCLDWSPAQACAAPADADATCVNATCGFACRVGFTRSGTRCVPSAVAPRLDNVVYLGAALGADGRIYTAGGLGTFTGVDTAEVDAYDATTNAWTARASLPSARESAVLALGNDHHVYAIGGGDVSLHAITTVDAFDPVANTWTPRAPLPSAIDRAAGVTGVDGKIYVIGGVHPGGVATTVYAYDAIANAWSQRAAMPTARESPAAALGNDGKIYVFGGRDPSLDDLATVEAYDPATDTWHACAALPHARREAAAATAVDGKIYVFGGDAGTSTTVAQVDAYDPATDSWTTPTTMAIGRYGLAVVSRGDLMYVLGGLGFECSCMDVEAYAPATNLWSP